MSRGPVGKSSRPLPSPSSSLRLVVARLLRPNLCR
ncbi:hypothetical protein ACP70R_028260 [Stipagrostis hirtigluma subsp. patula]